MRDHESVGDPPNTRGKREQASREPRAAAVLSAPFFYGSLLESTRTIPWNFDLAEDRFTHIGSQVEALLGYPVDAWYEPGFWQAHIHPEDRDWVPDFCAEAARLGEDHEFEYRMLAADGRTVWLREHVKVIDGPHNQKALQGLLIDITEQKQAHDVMEFLARATSTVDPDEFFRTCVRNLAQSYGARYAFIGLLLDNRKSVRTQAVWAGEDFAPNFEYNLNGTPCKDVLDLSKELIPRDAARLYPDDTMLSQMGVESYYGTPLIASNGRMLGLVSVMDTKPMMLTRWTAPLLGVFASRVAVEFERKTAIDSLRKLNASLERRVLQRTAELEMANEELKAFSYSVSHDLRSPLRAIDGFSQALLQDCAEQIDDTGRSYLQRVCAGVQRMSVLIDDMLKLSRITHVPLEPDQVDLSAMAEDIVTQLRQQDPGRDVSIEIAPGLLATGDPGLLYIVLENLLGNAWKYTARKAVAHIVFAAEQRDGVTVFQVSDNGTGFDMAHAGRLFGAFQRLHQREEFEGNGVGLATVQRIIHRHGGRISAEAVPDQGASFYFNLADQAG